MLFCSLLAIKGKQILITNWEATENQTLLATSHLVADKLHIMTASDTSARKVQIKYQKSTKRVSYQLSLSY